MTDRHPDAVPPIDVLDQSAVKRTLDECIARLLELDGFKLDLSLSNLKIVIMSLSCAIGTYAQFGPHEFPSNRAILAVCVVFYIVLAGLFQLVDILFQKDFIHFTYDKKDKKDSAICVATSMKKGEGVYLIRVESRYGARSKITKELPVGGFFSEQGDLDEVAVQKSFLAILNELETKKKA